MKAIINRSEMSYDYKSRKASLKEYVKKITAAKMITDAIEELIVEGFKVKVDDSVHIIPYNKKFPPSMQQWDLQMKLIADFTGSNPYKYIDENSATAYFYFKLYRFRSKKERWDEHFITIYIYVTTANTEQCEIVQTEKVQVYKESILTGYCKALSEKKYVIN